MTVLLEYWLTDAKRFWRSVLIIGFMQPLFFVLALGVGLGTVIDRNGTSSLGVPYLAFVAPALLVAAAVQIAANDASYPGPQQVQVGTQLPRHGFDPAHARDRSATGRCCGSDCGRR